MSSQAVLSRDFESAWKSEKHRPAAELLSEKGRTALLSDNPKFALARVLLRKSMISLLPEATPAQFQMPDFPHLRENNVRKGFLEDSQ